MSRSLQPLVDGLVVPLPDNHQPKIEAEVVEAIADRSKDHRESDQGAGFGRPNGGGGGRDIFGNQERLEQAASAKDNVVDGYSHHESMVRIQDCLSIPSIPFLAMRSSDQAQNPDGPQE